MKKIAAAVLVLIFLSPFYLNYTQALSCAEFPEIEDAYEKYDGVAIGYVDKAVQKRNDHELRVTISKSFKGVKKKYVTITEDMTWGNLNGPNEAGETYLFFLMKNGGKWENPLCSPTMKVADAAEQLEYLNDKEIIFESEAGGEALRSAVESKETKELSFEDVKSNDSPAALWIILAVFGSGVIILMIIGIVRERKYSKKK